MATETISKNDVGMVPASVAQSARPKFKVRKMIERQLFKIKPGIEYYFKLSAPMYVGKKIDDQKEAATLCYCVDLTSGEEGQIILGKILRDSLNENYPKDTYVGKSFAIELMKVPDKRYNILKTFNEIDPTEAQTTQVKPK